MEILSVVVGLLTLLSYHLGGLFFTFSCYLCININLRKAKKRDAEPLSDCRQKAILPRRGRIALSANERIAEFLDFAIQAKVAYVNKLKI